MNRKDFLKSALGTAVMLTGVDAFAKTNGSVNLITDTLSAPPAFTLPPLPYGFDALEPYIDKMTMEIHHDRHHKAYVDNLNKAVDGTPAAKLSIEELLKSAGKQSAAVRNNGGGHWNHTFFWQILKAGGSSNRPSGSLAEAISKSFKDENAFKEEFAKAATGRFGSGWAWLIVDKNKKLVVTSTPNQDNPLMDVADAKGTPVMGLDVWEHAYYLKYQNKRADYINAFWNVVNWEQANKNFEAAVK